MKKLTQLLALFLTTAITSCSSTQWIEGHWEGESIQSDGSTITVKLTAKYGMYVIEYPSEACGGEWTVVQINNGKAKFKEQINQGGQYCDQGSEAVISKHKEDLILNYYITSQDQWEPFAECLLVRVE